MKLIIENLGDTLYAYFETENHHRVVEPGRAINATRLNARNILANECDLSCLPRNSYMVIKVKK